MASRAWHLPLADPRRQGHGPVHRGCRNVAARLTEALRVAWGRRIRDARQRWQSLTRPRQGSMLVDVCAHGVWGSAAAHAERGSYVALSSVARLTTTSSFNLPT